MANLMDENGNVDVADHESVVTAGAGRFVAGDEDVVADIVPHANGHTTKEVNNVGLAERRVLVSAKRPRLRAVGIVNVERYDVGWRESGTLNQRLAVCGNPASSPDI